MVSHALQATLRQLSNPLDALKSQGEQAASRAMADLLTGRKPGKEDASGGDVHLHVHTMDASGVRDFLDKHKHSMRSALNASYGENSGGADYSG